MSFQSQQPSCPWMGKLIALLDSEQDPSGKSARQGLAAAVATLEQEAVEAGAEEHTLIAIRAAHALVDWGEMPPPHNLSERR